MAYVAGSRQGARTVRAERSCASRRRLAVLIDARTTPIALADALFEALAERGSVTVCRAYADWTGPDAQAWLPVLRTYGIEPRHPVSLEGDQGSGICVATAVDMALDAADLARESAVDAVAIVGDLGPAQPLLARLRASGVAVLAFGVGDPPYDVQALCDEYVAVTLLDTESDTGAALRRGRRRA